MQETQHQRTIRKTVKIPGIEQPSGNYSEMIIMPAEINTGIVFETPKEDIKAGLDHAVSSPWPLAQTLILQGKEEQIALPEHRLADLFAYGVDNARIQIKKKHSISSRLFQKLGHARDTYFLPNVGMKLCEALEDNTKEQPAQRRILRLEEKIVTPKLVIEPIDGEDLIIKAITDYRLAGGRIIQEKELVISPQTIKEISFSRGYCRVPTWAPRPLSRLVSKFFFLSYGFGSGCDDTNQFYRTKTTEAWESQESMEAEVACHRIYDTVGESSLLPGKLIGVRITLRGAGHKYTLKVLKSNLNKFHYQN